MVAQGKAKFIHTALRHVIRRVAQDGLLPKGTNEVQTIKRLMEKRRRDGRMPDPTEAELQEVVDWLGSPGDDEGEEALKGLMRVLFLELNEVRIRTN
jgi:hypothetical protein